MLSTLLNKVKSKAEAVEAYLIFCELRDEALANPDNDCHAFLSQHHVDAAILRDDRVFRHCSVITHLYAVYENFVEAVLSSWLVRLPKYYNFSDLSGSLQNAYRFGIATVIKDIEKRQLRHLSLIDVLNKYICSIKNSTTWQFVPEALTLHERNLRRSEIEKLFSVVGVSDFWGLLQGHHALGPSVTGLFGKKALEDVLEDFVTFRNEASHGVPDDILGSDSLRQWKTFTVSLCTAICDILTMKLLNAEKKFNPECVIGNVTEKFSGRIVVAKCRNCTLSVGQNLHFLKSRSVITTTIESLQVNDVDATNVKIENDEIEVGIKTAQAVKKQSQIFMSKIG